MAKGEKLGIWMDRAFTNLIEFTFDPIGTILDLKSDGCLLLSGGYTYHWFDGYKK